MFPASIQKLIEQFAKFPTVGPRTASRFVFYLLKTPKEQVKELIERICDLKKNTKICSFCFKSFEGERGLCEICSSPSRDKTVLCVVEKEIDLLSIEKTKKYNGLYFILGSTLSNLTSEDIKQVRALELKKCIVASKFKEIILATNSTSEGETTALYLQRILRPLKIKITRLGRGLPIGAEMEYADEETLSSALQSRR